VSALDNFLLKLFEKYAELLKRRFSDDFQEVCETTSSKTQANNRQIVSTDDYMPMPISNMDEYDKVVNVSWFTPDKTREELTSVRPSSVNGNLLTCCQISLCFTILSNVPTLLYRYTEFPQPILLLFGRSFPTPKCY
jgi:hypothetical protein